MMIGPEMRRIGSSVRRKRSGEWEVTERLYGAVGEPTGQHVSNDLFVWKYRSAPSVKKRKKVRICGVVRV